MSRDDVGGTGCAGAAAGIQPTAEAVREQLGRILGSPLFKNSKHYPALLRFVVEAALEGRCTQLKERALGVEVFGRDPGYDTNLDPVVRTSAHEVRKRLAQYYQEPGHEEELRLDLPSGCYVPAFRLPAKPARPEPAARAAWRPRYLAEVGAAAALILLLVALHARATSSALERFWTPVWSGGDPVLLCMGSVIPNRPPWKRPAAASGAGEQTVFEAILEDQVPFPDAVTMARLVGLLRQHGKKPDVRRARGLTLADLRRGPNLFIGAFDNPWTLRLNPRLRYTFELDPVTQRRRIRDRQNPKDTGWQQEDGEPYAHLTRDYAVVSRLVDPQTEEVTVVVAGVGKEGTLAAGEFVTEPRYLEAIAARAPSDWEHQNLQVVLETEVINGNAGPPQVLATYFWRR